MPEPAWRLLTEQAATPDAVVFVSPTARLAQVPWSALALPGERRLLV